MHLHKSKNCTVLISPTEPEIIEALNGHGIKTVNTRAVKALISYEQFHADMQLLIIGSKAFICCNSTHLAELFIDSGINAEICESLNEQYPANIRLNAALVGDKLICKKSALSHKVQEYCDEEGIKILDVKQGYAKCSTLVVGNAIITADKGIYQKAIANTIDALLIRPGYIKLNGADYGFIGGCSGIIGDTVVFFGDINTHPDANIITEFIKNKGYNAVSLINNTPLKDIGGLVQI